MLTDKLTQERLKECFKYDPGTGKFISIIKRGVLQIGTVVGCAGPDGYIRIRIDDVLYLAHRLAYLYMTGEMPRYEIDHVNLVRADNRWENLRSAMRIENTGNIRKHSDNTTGYKGVYRLGSRYRAQIGVNYKCIHLGIFDLPEQAAEAYEAAAKKHFGKYARTK
jgi:hypothetical protein